MKSLPIFILILATVPFVSAAQGLVTSLANTINFINSSVIPFLLAIAFLIVVINIVRYFVIDGANEQSRSEARLYAVYAVAAFVALALFWAVVTLITVDIGLVAEPPTPDYLEAN